jgi:hypothetical protein
MPDTLPLPDGFTNVAVSNQTDLPLTGTVHHVDGCSGSRDTERRQGWHVRPWQPGDQPMRNRPWVACCTCLRRREVST